MGCFQSKEAPHEVNGKPVTATSPAVAGGAPAPTSKAPQARGKGWVLPDATADVSTLYKFGKELGAGQFGITHLAIEKSSGKTLAIKSISKRKMVSFDDQEDVRREVQIMHHLAGHPNIVELYGAYEDKANVHLALELCKGGELFDAIVSAGKYSEKQAAEAIRTIVSVVAHCHNMGVIHRDLKPENFLLTEKGAGAQIKATDFGLSVFFKDDEVQRELVGSPFYVAPEVLGKSYGKACDIWSCGVILYILLSGVPPFYGENEEAIFRAVRHQPLDLLSQPWPKISAAAKDVVRRMLVRDPKKRATALEILNHEWVKADGVASDAPLEPEVLTRLKGFAAMNKLKKEALKIIASNLPPAEIEGLKAMFKAMDKDGSGTITVEEMRDGLRKKDALIPEAELGRIMAMADVNGDGTIDYEEFLAATIHQRKLENEEMIQRAFAHFDKDGSGTITKAELLEALQQVHGSDVNVDEILAEVDKDGNGMIDYEEFCAMMKDKNPQAQKGTHNRNHISTRAS